MSGHILHQALQSLDIPKLQARDSSEFDWLFENQGTVPFLAWFCDQVKLADELDSIEVSDSLPSEEEHLEDCTQDTDTLRQIRDKLSLHHIALLSKKPHSSQVKESARKEYAKCEEEDLSVNNEMNAARSSMARSVHDLCKLYQQTRLAGQYGNIKVSSKSSGDIAFLSMLDLVDYFEHEEHFTRQLSAYTKHEFFEGVADMTGDSDENTYQLLDLYQNKGLGLESKAEDCKELEQYHCAYAPGESKYVHALVSDLAIQAAVVQAKKFTSVRDNGTAMEIANKLRAVIQTELKKLELLQHDLLELNDVLVPALIEECATMTMTKFLRGDYDLKIKRQDYFHSKQNRIITELLSQRARTEMVTMCLASERKNHGLNQKLVVAVCLFLEAACEAHNEHMTVCNQLLQDGGKYSKNTIDTRRKDLIDLHVLLSQGRVPADQKLFLTYEQLASFSKQLSDESADILSRSQGSSVNDREKLSALLNTVRQLESRLDSTISKSGPPKLSLPEVSDSLASLCDVLDQLEKPALLIVKNVMSQNTALEGDKLMQIGRDLFVAFFNDQDKLFRIFRDIS